MRGPRFLGRLLFLRGLTIVVETSSSCNARCVWCWMYNCGRKPAGLMREEDFRRFIDVNLDLLRRSRIVPYHRGEALVHPRFLDMMEYAAARGCRFVNLSTNLSRRVDLERLLALPIPEYVVCVGGTTREVHEEVMRGTSFEVVTRNLRRLYEMNARYCRRIRVKMNVTRRNAHEVGQLPGFVESLGGRAEEAVIGTTGFPLPAVATREEKDDFFRDVVSEEAAPHLRFTYDLSRPDLGIRAKDRGPCRWLMPTVKFDGRVTVCCHDQLDRLDLGNAFERPLSRILRSFRYRLTSLRGLLKRLDFCRECN